MRELVIEGRTFLEARLVAELLGELLKAARYNPKIQTSGEKWVMEFEDIRIIFASRPVFKQLYKEYFAAHPRGETVTEPPKASPVTLDADSNS